MARPWTAAGLLWLIAAAGTLLLRPLLPIDETRCVSVAWEMYTSGSYLLPHLNGAPYSHKPPLVYWLIILGWKIWGVGELWPRLLPLLAGLGSLIATASLARLLWPKDGAAPRLAPLILMGTSLWTVFTTVVLYDIILVLFLLLGLLFYLRAWQAGGLIRWLAASLCLGLAILAKGAVALIPAAPLLLFLPWCFADRRPFWPWYGKVMLSLAAAAAIGFSWLAGAAILHGPGFVRTVLTDQYAGRLVNSFDHARPFYWYLLLLPAVLFPWSTQLGLWRGLRRLSLSDAGTRFCLVWMVIPLGVLSLTSGKQVYYLLPLLPAFSLLAGRLLAGAPFRKMDCLPACLVPFAVGITLFFLPRWGFALGLPWRLSLIPWAGAMIIASTAALFAFGMGGPRRSIAAAAAVPVLLLAACLSLFSQVRPAYDLAPAARFLKGLEERGSPLAHEGKYYGQYQFLGRLRRPVTVLPGRSQTREWLAANPDGYAVVYFRKEEELEGFSKAYVQAYGSRYLAVVRPAGHQP